MPAELDGPGGAKRSETRRNETHWQPVAANFGSHQGYGEAPVGLRAFHSASHGPHVAPHVSLSFYLGRCSGRASQNGFHRAF